MQLKQHSRPVWVAKRENYGLICAYSQENVGSTLVLQLIEVKN